MEELKWVLEALKGGVTGIFTGFLAALGVTHVKVSAIQKDVNEIKEDREAMWNKHDTCHREIMGTLTVMKDAAHANEKCMLKKMGEMNQTLENRLNGYDEKVFEHLRWADEKFTMLIKELQAWKTKN